MNNQYTSSEQKVEKRQITIKELSDNVTELVCGSDLSLEVCRNGTIATLRSDLSSALAQLRQAREEVEKALACFSVMPEASPHDKKGGIWDTWTDGCNYLKSALTTTAPK